MGRNRNRFKKLTPRETPQFKIEEKIDHDKEKPVFSFIYMTYLGSHCVSRCSQQDKASIIARLLRLSQSMWKDIISQPKKSGYETIPRRQFTVPIPKYATPEVDKLMVFRYSQVGRFAGTRHQNTFHVLLAGDNLYPH